MLVLEGVLATVTPVVETHRWRSDEITGWDLTWHDVPLKRMATMSRRFTDVMFDIVTFEPQAVADQAADFLNTIPLDYASIEAVDYRQFCSRLKFRTDVQQVIDSSPERLQRYGQLGRQVMFGGDF